MKLIYCTMALCFLVPAFAEQPERRDEKDGNLYSSFGKRDPFKVPDKSGLGSESVIDPLRKYRLEGYRLRAILRTGNRPQAMFEDPDGRSHVVVEGDRLGLEGARVSRIVNSEVIVTERSANYLGKETLLEKIISLPVESDPKSAISVGQGVQQGYPTAPQESPAESAAASTNPSSAAPATATK